jgi:hypothetical protein
MGSAVVSIAEPWSSAAVPVQREYPDSMLAELSGLLFASLPRSDQRRNGAQYLQGLLLAEGRKSIRNIAFALRPRANEQSLHHFINSSTWDWTVVRQALAGYLTRMAFPQAWVLFPMTTQMTGEQTVGVQRRFAPALGQHVNVQQAIGVWSSSERATSPISWRLHLSREWLDDSVRRRKASIPDCVRTESLACCMTEAMAEVDDWELPDRPVVLDGRGLDAAQVVLRLGRARRPVLARIDAELPLLVTEPTLSTAAARPLRAMQILSGTQAMRRLVTWTDDVAGGTQRADVVTSVRVRMPAGRSGAGEHRMLGGELMLLGVGLPGRPWPSRCWLTNCTDATPSALLQLGRALDRVAASAGTIGDEVGIRDFRGRSFDGWHRHVTLASAAYALTALSQRQFQAQASNVS